MSKKAEISPLDTAIKLYKQAAELDSNKANTKLGKIYLQSGDFSEATEYLQKTNYISKMEKVYKKLKISKKSSAKELAELNFNQAKFYIKNDLLEKRKVAYLDAISILQETDAPKNNSKISNIYQKLAEIASPQNKRKFIDEANKYKNSVMGLHMQDEENSSDLLDLSEI